MFKYLGELPTDDWQFCLVRIKGSADVIVVVDLSGAHPPRMIIDGKLVAIK